MLETVFAAGVQLAVQNLRGAVGILPAALRFFYVPEFKTWFGTDLALTRRRQAMPYGSPKKFNTGGRE